jgi:hypothetical protein
MIVGDVIYKYMHTYNIQFHVYDHHNIDIMSHFSYYANFTETPNWKILTIHMLR